MKYRGYDVDEEMVERFATAIEERIADGGIAVGALLLALDYTKACVERYASEKKPEELN